MVLRRSSKGRVTQYTYRYIQIQRTKLDWSTPVHNYPHNSSLNIICSVHMTVTDTWGHSVNGSWTGLTGFLQREEADVGSTGMFLLKERLSVVNFIAATTPTRYLYRSDTNTFQSLIFCTCRTKIMVKFFIFLE
jgi:hypothetical protein